MISFIIVVNVNGEMKTITEDEIETLPHYSQVVYNVEAIIKEVLDNRSKKEQIND